MNDRAEQAPVRRAAQPGEASRRRAAGGPGSDRVLPRLAVRRNHDRILSWLPVALAIVSLAGNARAWDSPGHRIVNQLALASLPPDFPDFVRAPAAQERISFLSGEPDRWRNTPDRCLRHVNEPDHYIDLEELARYGLNAGRLPPLRYDFVAALALARSAHPDRVPAIDPAHDEDHIRGLVGFLPWTIAESYARLKSEFSYLQTFQKAGGTPEEIENAEANVIYTMGVMGHYVGDASQPLHTTIRYNGWVGDNPIHYTTSRSFHAWIDGGYIAKVKIADDLDAMRKQLRPARFVAWNARPARPEDVFPAIAAFIEEQNRRVEPLYRLEKEGKLSGDGENGLAGKRFIETQLEEAGQMLGDLWVTAWQQSAIDQYLARQLERRRDGK